jgi:hypothetical protein
MRVHFSIFVFCLFVKILTRIRLEQGYDARCPLCILELKIAVVDDDAKCKT